jgi:hypothetical protein
MLLKRLIMGSFLCCALCNAIDLKIPTFIDKNDLKNVNFVCLKTKHENYSAEDQKQFDILWNETLLYIHAYAVALTNGENSHCRNSDEAVFDTTTKNTSMCIADRRDIRLTVKHIYQILANADKAKKCFSPRVDVNWLYNPGRELTEKSSVAKWAKRRTFDEFFDKEVTDPEIRKRGHEFAKNFYKMVTGDEIKTPSAFPYDVSANALPDLWAAAGWYPMYAEDSERNHKNFANVRGGYAYAEVLGNWGLLRIDTINGEKVGAEIGMTVQGPGTFYPYHNHATPEVYYNLRVPACEKEFKNFAVKADSPLLKTVYEDDKIRRVQFDASAKNEPKMWVASSSGMGPLIYLHQNTVHAFWVDDSCEAEPADKAWVSFWARTNANDKRNDYGTTRLCESAKHPGTPAHRGEVIQCDLTQTKW